jgi:epsilon-lactone hydrolase
VSNVLQVQVGGTGDDLETGLIREILALSTSSDDADIPADRMRYDAAEHEFPLSPGMQVDPVILGGVACELIGRNGDGDTTPRAVIVYLHGGGYVLGSPRSHRHLAGALGERCGLPVVVPYYSLAPEATCPKAVEEGCSVVLEIRQKWPSAAIALIGDSAGGGLAVATAASLRGSGSAVQAIVCLSPWLDLTCSRAAYDLRPLKEPSLKPERLRRFAAAYLGRLDPADPRASPLFAALDGLPPILVHVARDEILEEETYDFAARVAACGGTITVETWHNVVHVWHWYWPILRAGRDAIDNIATFLFDHLGRNRRDR